MPGPPEAAHVYPSRPNLLAVHEDGTGASHTPAASTFEDYYQRTRSEPIYVILGVQGSGTNLLGRLLTRLFKFSVMRDRSMVFNAAMRLGPNPTQSDVQREIRAFQQAVEPSALRRKTRKLVIRKNKPLRGVIDALGAADIRSGADFARVIYAYRAFSLGSRYIGIKSDDLWENLHKIDEVIPDRRIILLTRDFRDNLVSVGGKQFGPVEPICAARYVHQQLVRYGAEYRRAGVNGYHITYEALLGSTRQVVDDFALHFGLMPAVDLDAAIPALRFRPGKIGKWRRLSARDLAWCEGILQQELLAFGYALASSAPQPPGRRHILAATARDTLKRMPQKIRRMAARLRG